MHTPAEHPYDRWAPLYPPVAHNSLMAAEQEAMVRCLSPLRPARVLDLGAGTGRYGVWMRSRGAPLIVSLDLSMAMLVRHPPAHRIRVQADGRLLPFVDEKFDVVIAALVAGDIPDLAAWFDGVRRVMRPGGTFVYSDFHPEWRARGWRRTFTDVHGQTVDLPFVTHTHDDHRAAIAAAGFRCASMEDVPIAPRGYWRAWRGTPGSVPALVVVAAVAAGRPGPAAGGGP